MKAVQVLKRNIREGVDVLVNEPAVQVSILHHFLHVIIVALETERLSSVMSALEIDLVRRSCELVANHISLRLDLERVNVPLALFDLSHSALEIGHFVLIAVLFLNVVSNLFLLLVSAGCSELVGQQFGVGAVYSLELGDHVVSVVGIQLLGDFLNQGHRLRIHVQFLDSLLYFSIGLLSLSDELLQVFCLLSLSLDCGLAGLLQ